MQALTPSPHRSQVEINAAIICASAPSLQPLLKSLLKRLHIIPLSRGAIRHHERALTSASQSSTSEVLEMVDIEGRHCSVGRPEAIYRSPMTREYLPERSNIIIARRIAEEQAIINRVHAFTYGLSSINPPKAIFSRQSLILRNAP